MKTLKILLVALIASTSMAAIYKVKEKNCTKYMVTNEGPVNGIEVSARDTHGMYLKNMTIDFDNGFAQFDLKSAIILGFNRKVVDGKIRISQDHPEFNEFINLLQKDLFFISEICIDKNEVISFKVN